MDRSGNGPILPVMSDLIFWIAVLVALFFLFRWLQSRNKD
jgi:hypothetical protein